MQHLLSGKKDNLSSIKTIQYIKDLFGKSNFGGILNIDI